MELQRILEVKVGCEHYLMKYASKRMIAFTKVTKHTKISDFPLPRLDRQTSTYGASTKTSNNNNNNNNSGTEESAMSTYEIRVRCT